MTQFLAEREISVAADCTFFLYLPQAEAFHQREKYNFPPVAMALSDYNAIRAMAGYDPITLAPGTFTTQWRATAGEEDRAAFLASHPTLDTDRGTLTLAAGTPAYTDALGETLYNDYTDLVYILPDEVCQALMPVMTNRYLTTTEPIPYADARDLSTTFRQTYSEDSVEGQPRYTIRTSTEQVNESTASTFLLRTLMTYGAVVLMVTCFTILSLQQLWDARQHRYRFGVLRKLGVEERDLHRLITRQLAFWFGLPVGGGGLLRPGGGALLLRHHLHGDHRLPGFFRASAPGGGHRRHPAAALGRLLCRHVYPVPPGGGVRDFLSAPADPGLRRRSPTRNWVGDLRVRGGKGAPPFPSFFSRNPLGPKNFPNGRVANSPPPLDFSPPVGLPCTCLARHIRQECGTMETRNPWGLPGAAPQGTGANPEGAGPAPLRHRLRREQVGAGTFPKLKIPHQSHADFCSTDTAGGLDNKKRRYAPRGGGSVPPFLVGGFQRGQRPHLAHDFAKQSVVCYTLCRRCRENAVAAGEGKGI